MKCPPCVGTGRGLNLVGVCQLCNGMGQIPDEAQRTEKCVFCIGTGLDGAMTSLCEVCGGYGVVESPHSQPSDAAPLCMFIETGKPRTGHLSLEVIFNSVQGQLRICDPYYGTGSLYRLDLLKHCFPIQFLTSKADSSEANTTLPRALSEWKREHGRTEFRKDTTRSLHDRYILSDDEIIFLGHGLKDVGNKDSFVVRLPKSVASDVMNSVRATFDQKRANATQI